MPCFCPFLFLGCRAAATRLPAIPSESERARCPGVALFQAESLSGSGFERFPLCPGYHVGILRLQEHLQGIPRPVSRREVTSAFLGSCKPPSESPRVPPNLLWSIAERSMGEKPSSGLLWLLLEPSIWLISTLVRRVRHRSEGDTWNQGVLPNRPVAPSELPPVGMERLGGASVASGEALVKFQAGSGEIFPVGEMPDKLPSLWGPGSPRGLL